MDISLEPIIPELTREPEEKEESNDIPPPELTTESYEVGSEAARKEESNESIETPPETQQETPPETQPEPTKKPRGRPKKTETPKTPKTPKAAPKAPQAPKTPVRMKQPKTESDDEPLSQSDMETLLLQYVASRQISLQEKRRLHWANLAGLA